MLSTCCVAIESSVERPCAEEKTPAERQRNVREDVELGLS